MFDAIRMLTAQAQRRSTHAHIGGPPGNDDPRFLVFRLEEEAAAAARSSSSSAAQQEQQQQIAAPPRLRSSSARWVTVPIGTESEPTDEPEPTRMSEPDEATLMKEGADADAADEARRSEFGPHW